MGASEWVAIGLFVLGGVFSVMWWLLQNKDKQQERDIDNLNSELKKESEALRSIIKNLYDIHSHDVQMLNDFKFSVAQDSYRKHEIDNLFVMMRKTLDGGFAELKSSIRDLKNGNARP